MCAGVCVSVSVCVRSGLPGVDATDHVRELGVRDTVAGAGCFGHEEYHQPSHLQVVFAVVHKTPVAQETHQHQHVCVCVFDC